MTDLITRRKFLKGTAGSMAVLAGLYGPLPFLQRRASAAGNGNPILVVVSLRGGWDALNVVPPVNGDDAAFYQQARPAIQIPSEQLLPLEARFGLHPALKPLHELYQDLKLAIVHAVGLTYDTRSHFDAIEYMELGTPGEKSIHNGWISRAWLADAFAAENGIPVVALPSQPTALQGTNQTLSLSALNDLQLWDGGMLEQQMPVLRQLYAGGGNLSQSTNRTLDVLDLAKPFINQAYQPGFGVRYQEDEFSRHMQTIAQLIKMDTNLRY
ncbi:MAG: twin-arginine translocation signal domain-containing protein, partial [Anaerolineaceae bacterium]|nr:twin-arginine translocation signal domain-containing protein [Anaerolineaceae bacterium]